MESNVKPRSRVQRFLAELKRRQVLRVIVGYIVIGFGFLEGYQLVYPTLGFPGWVYDALVVVVIAGFPVSLVVSWFYDVTRSGIARTESLGGISPAADTPRADAVGAPPSRPDASTIAILPFADMSPERDQAYFGEGIAEEIIHALSRVEGLQVAARTSAFAFQDGTRDIREIGASLAVANVLEGSIRKAGSRLRITTQLIEVETGYHLWSETFEREMADIFAVQDEITAAVVTTVAPRLKASPAVPDSEPHPRSVEAYELYLLGRYNWYKRFKVGLETAVHYFQQAVEADPEYAPPYAGIADAFASMGIFGFIPPAAARAKAEPSMKRALALDPELARAHFSQGGLLLFFDWDYEGADAAYRRATGLDPAYAEAMAWRAFPPILMGRREEGLAIADRARDLDPTSPYVAVLMSLAQGWGGERDRAYAAAAWALEQDPGLSTAHYLAGMLLSHQDRHDEAIEVLTRGVALTNRAVSWLCGLGAAYGRAGMTAEATEVRDEIERRSGAEYVTPTAKAVLATNTGRIDDAFAAVDEAIEEGSPFLLIGLLLPIFDPLRDDPRYDTVLERMGISAENPARVGATLDRGPPST